MENSVCHVTEFTLKVESHDMNFEWYCDQASSEGYSCMAGEKREFMLAEIEYSPLEQKFWACCAEMALPQGVVLYDLYYVMGQKKLVVLLHHLEREITLDDCVAVDREFTPWMEEAWVPEGITLEVSSKGINCQLRCPKHFEFVRGEQVEILLDPEGIQMCQSQQIVVKGGKLVAQVLELGDEEQIQIMVEEKTLWLPVANFLKVHLYG